MQSGEAVVQTELCSQPQAEFFFFFINCKVILEAVFVKDTLQSQVLY